MTPFIGRAWADGAPLLVEALEGRKGYPRARERQRTRIVVDDFGDAISYTRRCANCWRWLPMDFNHFGVNSDRGRGLGYRCGDCNTFKQRLRYRHDGEHVRTLNRAWYARWKDVDPDAYEAFLGRSAARGRARRTDDIDAERARCRESSRRHRTRRDADPERRADYLAKARIDNKLRNLDAGKTLRERDLLDKTGGRLPVGPLLPLIGDMLDRVEGDMLALGHLIGTTDRTLRRWRTRPETSEVMLDTADRILIDCNRLWWEVWGPGVEGYEKASLLFTGERPAVAA